MAAPSEQLQQQPQPPPSLAPTLRQKNQNHPPVHDEDRGMEGGKGECARFLRAVAKERGCWALLIVAFLLALGIGAVVGLVPDTAADRYARVRHLYNGTDRCSHYDRMDKPEPCQEGGDDAQYSATVSNCFMNLLSFLLNPVLGSLSDARGRKPVLVLSLALSALPAAVLVLMLHVPAFRPFWYYAANATGGVNYFFGVAFAALSDAVPDPALRASSYGLLLACFYGGFALGPSLSLLMAGGAVAMASLALIVLAWVVAALLMPETLPPDVRRRRPSHRDHIEPAQDRTRGPRSASEKFFLGCWACLSGCVTRPFHEISILNQNTTIRLVAVGSFFGAMVYASDVTIVVYYIMDQLNVRSADLAQMFFLMGVVGIALQGGLLPPLLRLFRGETNLLVATFACGVVHNTLYGLAAGKAGILAALLLAQFTKLNFPILSSIASQTVSAREQGRIQGALFATNAIASAFGPLSMEYVYGKTKSSRRWYGGPGTMFFYVALLQVVGTLTVSYIRPSPAVEDSDDDDNDEAAPESSSFLLLRHGDGEDDVIASLDSDLGEPLLLETAPRLPAVPSEGDHVGE